MAELLCECPLTRGERILVAVDGSDFSDAAVDQAISLGGICNSEIFAIREHLDKAKEKVDKAGIPCETIVHMGGSPHEFIIQEAKDKGIDLICMGTHGRTGLKRILMGSVAQSVIGHAPCPVLVVPPGV